MLLDFDKNNSLLLCHEGKFLWYAIIVADP